MASMVRARAAVVNSARNHVRAGGCASPTAEASPTCARSTAQVLPSDHVTVPALRMCSASYFSAGNTLPACLLCLFL